MRSRMLIAAIAATLATCFLTAEAAAGPAGPRLAEITSWAFAIGTGTLSGDLEELGDRYAGYDLVIVDGQEVRPEQVARLQANGAIVLGYLSVGTIEEWRPWYRRLKPYRIEPWKDWEGEYFARVSAPGFRAEITERIAPAMLAKDLDGLFLDNTDMVETYDHEERGMRKLIGRLDAAVSDRGGFLFAQNGAGTIGPSLKHLDGWNREDVTWTWDFRRKRYMRNSDRKIAAALDELREIAAQGLLVTATDYTREGDGPARTEAVANACSAGALPYISDIQLRRVPPEPLRCSAPGGRRRPLLH